MVINLINVVLISTIFIGIVTLLAYCWRWKRYFLLGMKLPGPPAIPIVGNYFLLTIKDLNKLHHEVLNLLQTYGPVSRVWIGPVLIVGITDPDSIEKVVKSDKLCTRGHLVMKLLGPVFPNGLLGNDGEKWRTHRKIVNSGFRTNILESFVENFAKHSDILANKLNDLADGVTAHDIVPYFMRCTMDIIFETSSSIEVNAQINENNYTLKSLKIIIDSAAVRLMKYWLIIDWIFSASKIGKEFHTAIKHLHDLINNELDIRRKMRQDSEQGKVMNKNPSLMDDLIHNFDFNKDEIVGELTSIIGAGTETTSNTCCYVLALLAENQHIQARVMQEQEDIFGEDILRPVRSEDLPRMVYLEQVFKEAMRIFPPVPVHFREAMKEIDLGNGYIIPAMATVIVSVYTTHRDPKHFPDPENFDPDRFSPQNSAGRHPYAYTPFGLGRRMCVGHLYATMEVKTILSTVLRRYRVTEIQGGIAGLQNDLTLSFVLTPVNGVRVKLLPRSHNSQITATEMCK